MKMIVTKFSDGKYRNEGELFAEPISDDNVKLMVEMIALQVLRNANSFDYEVVEKLYNGLVKDMHHMNERGYIISDGYDYAQIAICFLLQLLRKTDRLSSLTISTTFQIRKTALKIMKLTTIRQTS